MARPVMDEVGDLSLRPEVVQAGVILQAVLYPLIQVGDGEYLGQDRFIWTGSIFKGDSSAARNCRTPAPGFGRCAPKSLSKTRLYKVKCIGIACYSMRPFSTRCEGLRSCSPSLWISQEDAMRISDERVGEWGLVKKMSLPAHASQSFDRINTFLAIIYDCFCPYAFCLAIFAAKAPATKPASTLTTVRTEQDCNIE